MNPFTDPQAARDWITIERRKQPVPGPWSCLIIFPVGVREITFEIGAQYYGRMRRPQGALS